MARRTLEVPVWRGPGSIEETDRVVEEAPLKIRVGGSELGVLMRTPGEDQALALGFALSEGILTHPDQVDEVRLCRGQRPEDHGVAEVRLEPGVELDLAGSLRTGLISSGCGVCGREMLDKVIARQPPEPPAFTVDGSLLLELPRRLRATQDDFEATGGNHAAGLFEVDGSLLYSAEDVGRHNAVDKVLGAAAMAGRWPAPPILVVTSRGSFDVLQKAIVSGVRLVILVSAPSALAVQMAVASGLTLVGFVREQRFTVYAGRGRVRSES